MVSQNTEENSNGNFLTVEDFLEGPSREARELEFFSFQDQFRGRGGGNQQRFFESQFNPIFNQFLGGLGQQLQQGTIPTGGEGSFTNFLSQPDFFNQRFASIAPSVRGANTNRFAPSARFLNF
jgi:hypothetical protein|tara:strand:+ start:157 stop:525 length:369 start_codon:yes stop_codon:yes gene_type:complete